MPSEPCPWCGQDPLYRRYHDGEWGVPVHDDTVLFELLVLEGAQAGLSWLTVLRKREHYRRAFEGFDPRRVAAFDAARIEALLQDPGIIRNRLKIASAVSNARAFLEVESRFGSFDRYIWDFVDGRPIINRFASMAEVPAVTPLAETISHDLKRRGFRFVGPTIVYAYLQATGLVNDHLVSCPRHAVCAMLAA
ncbi:MAG TPA: DNA-3-methyladenine glycosylase I [Candidatus Macondimonas sp.]|nr:DNA-3-methyladenine glycosylase I [Candidatus Macondimonas sp.]